VATPQRKHYDAPAGTPLAPRRQHLGVHTLPVNTRVARAQLFISQGGRGVKSPMDRMMEGG
jgi:hypothetical protein